MISCSKKYVLTGGPCTGKTTLLRQFQDNGYRVIPEVATFLINKSLENGEEHPIKDRDKFQRRIIETQLAFEAKIKNVETVFLERGFPDGLAYYKLDKIEPPQNLIEASKSNKYHTVFLLDFIKKGKNDFFYENTQNRLESFEEACKIHYKIKEVYENLGYKLISIPSLSVDERVKFVLNKINELNQK